PVAGGPADPPGSSLPADHALHIALSPEGAAGASATRGVIPAAGHCRGCSTVRRAGRPPAHGPGPGRGPRAVAAPPKAAPDGGRQPNGPATTTSSPSAIRRSSPLTAHRPLG